MISMGLSRSFQKASMENCCSNLRTQDEKRFGRYNETNLNCYGLGDYQKLKDHVVKNSEHLSGEVTNLKTFASLASSTENLECYDALVHLLDSRSAAELWSERYAKMQQGFLQCLGPFVTRGSKKQVKAESFIMAYSAVKQIPHHEGVRNDLAAIVTLDQKSRSTEYITKEEITELSKFEHREVWNFEGINATPALEKGGRAQRESLR
eukprot:g32998.t1